MALFTQKSKSSQISKFSSRTLAFEFANRCTKLHLIILGDDGKFWVTTPRIAEQLHKAGHSYAD